MKRFHVHVSVEKLEESIRFYSSLFGTAPTVVQPDYAKWMLDDPRVNFAISQRGRQPGVNHLGFQVEDDAELKAMRGQLEAADAGLLEQTNAACCYARSDKYWVTDPQGVAWENLSHARQRAGLWRGHTHRCHAKRLPARYRRLLSQRLRRHAAHERQALYRALPLHGQLPAASWLKPF